MHGSLRSGARAGDVRNASQATVWWVRSASSDALVGEHIAATLTPSGTRLAESSTAVLVSS